MQKGEFSLQKGEYGLPKGCIWLAERWIWQQNGRIWLAHDWIWFVKVLILYIGHVTCRHILSLVLKMYMGFVKKNFIFDQKASLIWIGRNVADAAITCPIYGKLYSPIFSVKYIFPLNDRRPKMSFPNESAKLFNGYSSVKIAKWVSRQKTSSAKWIKIKNNANILLMPMFK